MNSIVLIALVGFAVQDQPKIGNHTESTLVGRSRQISFEKDKEIELLVPISRPGAGYSSVVVFPENISDYVVRLHDHEISLEHVKTNLFVTLLKPVEGHLDAIGSSGTVYRLLVKPVTEGVYDNTVRISGAPARQSEPTKTVPPLKMLRAMRLSQAGEDMRVCVVDQLLRSDDSIQVRGVYVYESPGLVGVVARLTNLGERPLLVRLNRFAGQGLIASAAREFRVDPQGHTYLYFVFAREP